MKRPRRPASTLPRHPSPPLATPSLLVLIGDAACRACAGTGRICSSVHVVRQDPSIAVSGAAPLLCGSIAGQVGATSFVFVVPYASPFMNAITVPGEPELGSQILRRLDGELAAHQNAWDALQALDVPTCPGCSRNLQIALDARRQAATKRRGVEERMGLIGYGNASRHNAQPVAFGAPVSQRVVDPRELRANERVRTAEAKERRRDKARKG